MKKVKYLVYLSIFILGVLIIEMYVFRGYFISGLVDDMNKGVYKLKSIQANDPDTLLNYHYSVEWTNDSTLSFNVRNNGFGCQYFTHYRYDGRGYGLFDGGFKEEVTSILPYLYKLSSPLKNEEKTLQFDCGTGLGQTTFCPFHSVTTSVEITELLGFNPNPWDFTNFKSDYFHDIFYDEKICSLVFNQSETILNWNTDYICNEKDSVELQFHLPLHSVYDKKERKIYSNSIKVAYCDLLEELKAKMIRKSEITELEGYVTIVNQISFSDIDKLN
jgi:hypothetical protein